MFRQVPVRHMIEHMPGNMLQQVPKHVPDRHVLDRHVLDRHVPEHVLARHALGHVLGLKKLSENNRMARNFFNAKIYSFFFRTVCAIRYCAVARLSE